MRRILALIGFVVVLALALTLLWRVHQHHNDTMPYDDEPALVSVKIARPLC